MSGDGKKKKKAKQKRRDGYKNLMNKYGTAKDFSEGYHFEGDSPVTDTELTLNYEENGLFSKIIDLPADDAVSSGFSYGINNLDIETFINDSLDELDFEEKAATAIKWSRLYGGSVIVMLIDDGKRLEDPVDWDNIRGIDELLVFERPSVQPDYSSIYTYKPNEELTSKFGLPEYYDISTAYGTTFRVHESRCLLFKNGVLPSVSSKAEYRFFGIPEYVRIHKSLQETVTTHGNGPKLLDRAVQAIYKMKDLAEKLLTEEGEDEVLKRLHLIDMTKGIINSIAIDADGEDYDYRSISFSGVKDIIDSTCNMLSAVTQIPQTKLFGRSPAGENSTGEGDMENYYSFVGKIQKINLKNNLKTLIDIILIVGKLKEIFEEIPKYTLKFNPLWNLSESEEADVEQTRASTELAKAQTAQIYVDMQAIDASEVRERLAESGEFTVNDILDEEEEDWNEVVNMSESEETNNTALSEAVGKEKEQAQGDSIFPTGCGVIVVKDGKILVGTRKDNGLVCGPGGHIEMGETPEEAAIRETREEFGINIAGLIPITLLSDMSAEYCPSQVFLCTEFYGEPVCFNQEMEDARFEDIRKVLNMNLFLPFRLSLEELIRAIRGLNEDADNNDEWKTINGQHVNIGKGGEVISGNPKVLGRDTPKDNARKQKKSSEKKKKALKESPNRGTIYAGEKVSSYISSPKTLGDTTHKEKYDDFKEHGVEVKPLGKGRLKGIEYELGGGYRINGTQDGQYMQYHPADKSHHKGEYYKLCSGKTGAKRYKMNGEPKDG